MKATKESVSPTRVKLTVEVPFEELSPSVDAAYKRIARQVRIQGFRPGKVPPRILDQRVGRPYVLDEALQDALPRFYSDAVRDQDVMVLGRPAVDVSSFADGEPLVFTAEVDVRPEVTLPDYAGIPVTVDDAEVTEEQVDEQVASLQERFATLEAVERPAEDGDFVSIDLTASVGGEAVPGAEATGLSHEVGRGGLIDGLDETLVGMTEGETRTFTTRLLAGEYADRDAEVSVTVRTVKAKQTPALDDEFAQTASEFDTLDELRADIRARLERVARLQQGMQARDRTLEALLDRVDLPLPEQVVADEVEAREENITRQLEEAGLSMADYLDNDGRTEEDFRAELRASAESSVKAQFVLDAIAEKEELSPTDSDLTELLVRRAQRAGVSPSEYAQQLSSSGQLPGMLTEVVRGKALAQVLESAQVTDASGRPVDLAALREDAAPPSPGQAVAAEPAADEGTAPAAPAAEPAASG